MTPHEITITIHRPEDLFVDSPEDNPMQPEWEANSGIQRVFDHLKTRRLRRGVRVTIQHPTTLVVPDSGHELLKKAIDRYCDARIAENAQERKFTILTGLTGFAYGLAVSFGLSLFFGFLLSLVTLPDWIETSVTGLVTIGVWAIVWGPLAAIFFDWLPNWTAIRVYRVIKRGEFELKAISMDGAARIF